MFLMGRYVGPREIGENSRNAAITSPGEGARIGTQRTIPSNLHRASEAQLWRGEGTGEIWEATLDGADLNPKPLHALWYALETTLPERGCTRTYTLARDTRYPNDAYEAFLREREYAPSPEHAKRTPLAL